MITEDSIFWIKRRYSIVRMCLDKTIEFTEDSICHYDSYEEFEYYFFSVFMDCLHHYFYNKNTFDYEGVFHSLVDLFYVKCKEFYFDGRERCS